MALHTKLPIYKVVYDLLQLVVKLAAQMPRNLRRQLGEKLIHECVELTVLVFRANVATDKGPHLLKLIERLQVAELLTRLATDLRCISQAQYASVIDLTGSISRQANGWRKSSASAPAA